VSSLLCCCQVVVDDDRVGLDLVRLLNKAGRGRVTFMPLNKLRVKDVAYPTQFGDSAVPLHKLLKCPDQYKKAVQEVGSTVACMAYFVQCKPVCKPVWPALHSIWGYTSWHLPGIATSPDCRFCCRMLALCVVAGMG